MAEALQNRILAIGRDALMWLEKVKRLHAQTRDRIERVPLFEHNAAMILENRMNTILGETSALKNSIARLVIWDNKNNTWEISAGVPLGHLERIRKAHNDILAVAKTLATVLKSLREGVAKELEEDVYIKRDLAGLEALVWKMNEVTAPDAHRAVRKLISQTRYGERKERTMSRQIKAILQRINGMILVLDEIIPAFSEWEKELGSSTVALIPRVKHLEEQRDRVGMAIFFSLFLKAALNLCNDVNVGRIKNIVIKFNSTLSRMKSVKGQIDNLEARQGGLLNELESAIKSFKKKGWLQTATT